MTLLVVLVWLLIAPSAMADVRMSGSVRLAGSIVMAASCNPANCFYISTTGNDSNPGTLAQPWLTITKASETLTGGQTAIVLDGTYEEPAIFFRNTSGTANAPITLRAQNQSQAIVNSLSGCQASINIYGNYIMIVDMRLSVSPSEPVPSGCSTANYVVHAWEDTEPTPGSPSSGFVGFVLRGCTVDFSTHRNGGLKTRQDNSLIENNTFHDSVEVFNSRNAEVRNNTVIGEASKAFIPLIVVKGGARNTKVYNNVVHLTNSSGNGVLLGGSTCLGCSFDNAYEAYNAVAYNNVVVNESGSASDLYGFQGCKDCTLLNNVGVGGNLVMNNSGGSGLGQLNVALTNNIITCLGGAATSGWTTATVDYNDFFNCTGVPSQTHPITGNPLFVNAASDWHLQGGSPALAAGTAVPTTAAFTSGTLDTSKNKDGAVRSAPWNLGLY